MKTFKKLAAICLVFLFFLTGCVGDGTSNPLLPGIKGPTVSIQQNGLLISLVFIGIPLNGGGRVAIPETQNSYVELSPDLETNGTLMAISLDNEDIDEENWENLPKERLPAGQPIPDVPGGELPAVEFSAGQFSYMKLFIGQDKIGFFWPQPVAIAHLVTGFDYYVGRQKAGKVYLVGHDGFNNGSGVLLLLDVNKESRKRIKLIQKYMR